MTLLKKLITWTSWSLKDFHFTEEKPEFWNICKQEMFKGNFFSKNKNVRNNFFKLLLKTYTGLGYFILITYQFNLQSMGRPDNERQQKTLGFLAKISESHWTNLSRGAMTASRKLQLLESDWITWLVLLCCSVYAFGLWIYCGSINTVTIFELSLSFTEKRLCRSFR